MKDGRWPGGDPRCVGAWFHRRTSGHRAPLFGYFVCARIDLRFVHSKRRALYLAIL